MGTRLVYRILLFLFALLVLVGCEASNKDDVVNILEENTEISTTDIVNKLQSDTDEKTTEYHKLTADEKMEDFEFLFDTLSSNYPYFEMNKRLYAVDWLANKDMYIEQIEDTKGDLEFYMVIDGIMNDLNYGHAEVLNDKRFVYSLNLYTSVLDKPWLEVLEDPVVQNRYSYALKSLDKDNMAEENVNPDNVVLEKWPEMSTAYIKIKSFNHFNIEADWKVLQPFVNDIDDMHSLIIDIRGNTGGDSAYWSEYLVPELITEQKKSYQYYCFRGGEYAERFIKYKLGCSYSELNVIDDVFCEELSANIPEEVKSNFRFYFTNTTIIEPMNEAGYQGDIYLLVDHNVFSSAEQFVQFVRDTELAYIIGEPTSGESAGFDSLFLNLPNSGYVVRFPGTMVLSSNGTNTNEVIADPDLVVDSKMALEEAMTLIKNKNEVSPEE